MQSQASAVPFSFKMQAIPCKQWGEVAGQEAPAVLDAWRWPPSPRRAAQLQLQRSPRRRLRRRGSCQGLPPPRRALPPPGPQKPEFSDLAMQQINKWMELESFLERPAGRASQSEGEEKRFCRRLAGWVPVRIMISMLLWFHQVARWGTWGLGRQFFTVVNVNKVNSFKLILYYTKKT